jgi:hypothetical protein
MSLIEAMTAAAVLGIGILGSFGGMVLASKQNTSAAKLGRADAAASAVRAGLQAKSYLALNAGPFSNCTGSAAVAALTDGLNAMVPAPTCIVDLDNYDGAVATPTARIVPSYNPNDGKVLRRVLVMWNTPAVGPVEMRTIAVVVSFNDGLGTRFVRQFVGAYDPALNKLGIEI